MADERAVSRRLLLAGLGSIGGAAALGAGAAPAAAAPTAPAAQSGTAHDAPPAIPTPIASAPATGVSYRFMSWQELTPEVDIARGRHWGGVGTYTDQTSDYVAAFVDIAPGARVHDVELYLSNTVDVTVYGITWVAGTGSYPSPYWLQSTAPANSAPHAQLFVVPAGGRGPFPHGTKIGVSVLTPTDGSVQINGFRIGFMNGPLQSVLLAAAVTVYNSHTHDGPLASGASRTIALDSAIPIGAVGAIVSVTVSQTVNSGSLVLHAGGTPAPSLSSISWDASGRLVSNQVTVAVNAARKVVVTCAAGSTHLTLDVVGYLV